VILAIGFPNPVGWAIDKVTGLAGDAATAGFEAMIGGLTAWVVDAVVWIVGGVFNFFLDSTDPNVQADWFVTGTGPYATTASIGASLLLLFVLAGIIQGTISGDVGGMLRRIALELPVSIVAMIGLVTITQVLIRLTDALSGQVLDNFQDDITKFGTVVGSLSTLQGPNASALVVVILGLVTVLAGLALVAELVVRSALIYIVVALAPLVFATRLWPATKGASRKLLDLLVALIFSKLVIAVALAVAAAAAVGAGSGGEVKPLPTPEVFAEDPGGSVTQAVGILLTAAAAFGVSAFSPLLIARLLPMTEAAVVAQGVKGGPGARRAPGDDDGEHRTDGLRSSVRADRGRPGRSGCRVGASNRRRRGRWRCWRSWRRRSSRRGWTSCRRRRRSRGSQEGGVVRSQGRDRHGASIQRGDAVHPVRRSASACGWSHVGCGPDRRQRPTRAARQWANTLTGRRQHEATTTVGRLPWQVIVSNVPTGSSRSTPPASSSDWVPSSACSSGAGSHWVSRCCPPGHFSPLLRSRSWPQRQ
jgi:hypothetical protein